MPDSVRVGSRHAIKRVPGDIELEYAKGEALAAISRRNGFRTPQPVELDRDAGLISYELLPAAGSLRGRYLEFMKAREPDADTVALFREAGKTLATIHAGLAPDPPQPWEPPAAFEAAMRELGVREREAYTAALPQAPLHCDFGFSNVKYMVEGSRRRIVVYDCSPNGFTTFHVNTVGPIYLDLAGLVVGVDGLVPVRHYPAMHWSRLGLLKAALLEGYEAVSGIRPDARWSARFAYATARCYFRHKYRLPLKHAVAMRVLYNSLKGNRHRL